MQESMSLKYEPASVPQHISVKLGGGGVRGEGGEVGDLLVVELLQQVVRKVQVRQPRQNLRTPIILVHVVYLVIKYPFKNRLCSKT